MIFSNGPLQTAPESFYDSMVPHRAERARVDTRLNRLARAEQAAVLTEDTFGLGEPGGWFIWHVDKYAGILLLCAIYPRVWMR
jgi:hypothetical protein